MPSGDRICWTIGTLHGPFRPHEGRGVGLAWLALHYDHLSAAQALILAGAGLETTDNLLYSELDSPACDRICPWLDEQLACRHAFITAILGGIIQEYPPSTSPANRPNKLTRLRGHSDVITLIASFVGVKSGATPRRLRQARDILRPVLHNRYTWNSRAINSRAFLLVTEALTLGSSEGLPRPAGNPTSARLYHEFWQARNPRQSGRELLPTQALGPRVALREAAGRRPPIHHSPGSLRTVNSVAPAPILPSRLVPPFPEPNTSRPYRTVKG